MNGGIHRGRLTVFVACHPSGLRLPMTRESKAMDLADLSACFHIQIGPGSAACCSFSTVFCDAELCSRSSSQCRPINVSNFSTTESQQIAFVSAQSTMVPRHIVGMKVSRFISLFSGDFTGLGGDLGASFMQV